MINLFFITCDTPDGEFNIIFDEYGVALASGFDSAEKLKQKLSLAKESIKLTTVNEHPYKQAVRAYYLGDKTALSGILRRHSGTDFQRLVWGVLSDIPYGKTISYKELADLAGSPRGVRAAGTACGKNKLVLLIPCHRVLRSDGAVGDYLYGAEIKESLLRREGVKV